MTKAKELVSELESQLLEKEYELREVELDSQMRAQDAKLAQVLDELKKRCRGYLGQFFELIKPISKKYEMACKVSLLPQLRYLLVDTVESSHYVSDFLKEKGI